MRSKLAARTVRALNLGYIVTTDGDVISPFGVKLSLTSTHSGYLKFNVSATEYDKARIVIVHQLAALQWFGMADLQKGIQVRHLNGIKTDNSRENIAIGSASDNQLDIPREVRVDRSKKGVRAMALKARKFTDEEIREIRASHTGVRQLARELGVAKSTISYIVNRHTYKEVY